MQHDLYLMTKPIKSVQSIGVRHTLKWNRL